MRINDFVIKSDAVRVGSGPSWQWSELARVRVGSGPSCQWAELASSEFAVRVGSGPSCQWAELGGYLPVPSGPSLRLELSGEDVRDLD